MGTPDLVLIICDTARADAFSAWGGPVPTPTMDALCREGVVFENAFSAAPWTLPSTASIFSGELPSTHGVSGDCLRWEGVAPTSPAKRVRRRRGSWLPRDLRARGYRTWGASCNPWISRWSGFGSGFHEMHHFGRLFSDLEWQANGVTGSTGATAVDKGGEEASSAFLEWVGARAGRPSFAFLNLMEVHAPYDPPTPYYPFPEEERAAVRKTTAPISAYRRAMWFNLGLERPAHELAPAIRDVYYASARYEDALLGRLVDAIRDSDRPTVVAVVADHGEHLGEHGLFGHNTSLYEPLLRVPLVIWGHRVAVGSGRVEGAVSTLSVSRTLLSCADETPALPEPSPVIISEYESTARQHPTPAEIREAMEAEGAPEIPSLSLHAGMAAREGNLKYVATADGRERLYDLSMDPGEEHDLADSKPETVARLRPLRDAWQERRDLLPDEELGALADAEIVEHLRSLGYVE